MRRLIAIGMMGLVVLAGCQKPATQQKSQEEIPVRVRRLMRKSLDNTIDYVGNIKAQDEALVYPKVSGKVSQKLREDGSPVAKGDIIAYIDRDEVGLKFEKAPVESPLAGVVGRVYMDIGTQVSPQTPVAMVVNMERAKINLDIPEKYLPLISVGQTGRVGVDAYPEEEFIATVSKVSPMVDLTVRAAPIELILENPGHRLRPGMFARVRLVLKARTDVLVLLKEALIGKEPNLYVYVIKDKKAVMRKISVGLRQGPYYEVTGGLESGDLVVIMGQQRLYEGAPVLVQEDKE